MSRRKRILYFSPCWPGERSFGTQLRVQQMARVLREIGDLNFVVVRFDDDQESVREKFGPNEEVLHFVELKVAPPRGLVSRLRCGFDSSYLRMQGQVIDLAQRDQILAQLKDFDLIWLHHPRVANMFDLWHWDRSVMDIDDLPSVREWGNFEGEKSWRARWRGGYRYLAARRREQQFSRRFTVLSVCSEKDKQCLDGVEIPVHVIPNGFKKPAGEPLRNPVTPPRIGLVGTFNYPPNVEGARWFVDHCWGVIRARFPTARLRLMGRDSDAEFGLNGPNIDRLGWLASTAEEIATWSVMIVPIKLGAGTRVKIAEGLARKCPIVSTSLGAYGYTLQDGHELLLADSAKDFAAACIKLIDDPAGAGAMAERGYRAFLEKWTWDAIAPRVWETAEDCLRRSGSL